MEVKVRLFANLREIAGEENIVVETSEKDVQGVLDSLIDDYPDLENEIFEDSERKNTEKREMEREEEKENKENKEEDEKGNKKSRGVKSHINILVNGENAELEDGVVEGDEVGVFPPVSGG